MPQWQRRKDDPVTTTIHSLIQNTLLERPPRGGPHDERHAHAHDLRAEYLSVLRVKLERTVGSGKELVKKALTLRRPTSETVGWCVCATGMKAAQFAAMAIYDVPRAAVRKAYSWIAEKSGDFELTTGEQCFISKGLELFTLGRKVLTRDEVFINSGAGVLPDTPQV